MLTIITGILIIIYCLYNLLYIDMFIKKFRLAKLENTIDALSIVGIVIWLVVQFFFQSGPITLIPLLFGLINPVRKSERKTKTLHIAIITSIILTVSFVLLNKLWFNLNFWTFNFI